VSLTVATATPPALQLEHLFFENIQVEPINQAKSNRPNNNFPVLIIIILSVYESASLAMTEAGR
jgi:hypothetical protein